MEGVVGLGILAVHVHCLSKYDASLAASLASLYQILYKDSGLQDYTQVLAQLPFSQRIVYALKCIEI